MNKLFPISFIFPLDDQNKKESGLDLTLHYHIGIISTECEGSSWVHSMGVWVEIKNYPSIKLRIILCTSFLYAASSISSTSKSSAIVTLIN